MNKYVAMRRELHRIPEKGFEEYKTQTYVLKRLAEMPQDHMVISTWRTGILVKITGTSPEKTIGWRTDMDGLAMQEETGYAFASEHEGFMHACGHDFHMAIALGIVEHFAHHPAKNSIVVLFQPAEEEPGGARPMLESETFKDFSPDEIYALHIAPEYQVGEIATKKGILFANSCEVDVTFTGTNAHGARPHLGNDALLAGAHFISQSHNIVSRNISPNEEAVVSFGTFHSGEARNIIAKDARLHGTVRAYSEETMKRLQQRIQSVAEGVAQSFDCETSVAFIDPYVDVTNHDSTTDRFFDFMTHKKMTVTPCEGAMTSEDFGYFLKRIPGTMFWLGVDSDYGLHVPKLDPDEEAIVFAIDTFTEFLSYC